MRLNKIHNYFFSAIIATVVVPQVASAGFQEIYNSESSNTLDYHGTTVASQQIEANDPADHTLVGATGSNSWVRAYDEQGNQIREFNNGIPSNAFGAAIAGIGDTNGDGFKDFLVGAPSSDYNGTNAGAIFIISGAYVKVGSNPMVLDTFYGNPGEQLGATITALSDVNGDTRVAVGAPGAQGYFGEVKFFFITPSSFPFVTINPPYSTWTGAASFYTTGVSMAAGDFDGDGDEDIVVGHPFANGGEGAVTILDGSTLLSSSTSPSVLGNVLPTPVPEPAGPQNFGWSVLALDVQRDGLDELAIGIPKKDTQFVDRDGILQTRLDAGEVQVWQYNGLNANWEINNHGGNPARPFIISSLAKGSFGWSLETGTLADPNPRTALFVGSPTQNNFKNIMDGIVHGFYADTGDYAARLSASISGVNGNNQIEKELEFGAELYVGNSIDPSLPAGPLPTLTVGAPAKNAVTQPGRTSTYEISRNTATQVKYPFGHGCVKTYTTPSGQTLSSPIARLNVGPVPGSGPYPIAGQQLYVELKGGAPQVNAFVWIGDRELPDGQGNQPQLHDCDLFASTDYISTVRIPLNTRGNSFDNTAPGSPVGPKAVYYLPCGYAGQVLYAQAAYRHSVTSEWILTSAVAFSVEDNPTC